MIPISPFFPLKIVLQLNYQLFTMPVSELTKKKTAPRANNTGTLLMGAAPVPGKFSSIRGLCFTLHLPAKCPRFRSLNVSASLRDCYLWRNLLLHRPPQLHLLSVKAP